MGSLEPSSGPGRPADGAPWHLISGEYPPDLGGIADYSAQLARSLASAGSEVHVWTTGREGEAPDSPGVTVHRIGKGWGRRNLKRLGHNLDAFAGPRQLLVQYAPNSWGFKGANLGLTRWLVGREARGDRVDAMFHEVWYIPGPSEQRLVRRLLPLIQRPMAWNVLRASDRVFVSTPPWAKLLGPIDPIRDRKIGWLPVPSNVPVVDDLSGVEAARIRLGLRDKLVVGSFGTFSNTVGDLLIEVLPRILRGDPRALGLLIGRNAREFAARLQASHPDLSTRIVATGGLPSEDISRHLQVCDLLVQVYPDGVCGRRGTVMAALAHGVAVVANEGSFTSPDWRESGGLALAPDPVGLARLASGLLDDPAARIRLGALGRDLYGKRFAIGRTVDALIGKSLAQSLPRSPLSSITRD